MKTQLLFFGLIKEPTMQNQLPDSVNFTLHFTDIQEIDDSLTNDEARQILQIIARKGEAFDSETLDSWIDFFRADKARG
jgi:hypothetical protein